MSRLFQHLPSVDPILTALTDDSTLAALPRPLLRELVNEFLDIKREEIRSGVVSEPEELAFERLLPAVMAMVRVKARPHFRRVLNATGVVIHTNMGRSLLAPEAVQAVVEACARYSNLEFDLATGERGSRYSHVEELLCTITGAEAAVVVNNNAAAVMLMLDTLAKGREVIVSRGQLVEIGGSFRIPDVMAKSGATLREVGATNRTHVRDYEQAIGDNTAALMRVHTSNFRMVGFTGEVDLPRMRELGDRYGLPVLEDLGSGTLFPLERAGMPSEPTVQEVVRQGADIVSFSGDKVLGGPQAGIIVGREEWISRIKVNPMNRALRIDKMTLAALEATLRLYLDMDSARTAVPTLRMITAEYRQLRSRAATLRRTLDRAVGEQVETSVRRGASRVGGGAFPERDLETALVAVVPKNISVDELRQRLLATDPPLVGRIEDNAFCLDPRTLASDEYRLVAEALNQALRQ
ncbi:L-seryl-tRNA(Sec) selenium transferase [Pseudodesulfovibrio senegalensis]|uniref:L-seryl-tRNA(Sec) selenium transferase n=1 Tax=Pseudodesulfovibrio senegalensis TaxID=1721087 RepID=A0A6N6N594_9BACT|nr:L-seryl-tRNA(Sec) selenium transferase [Pseudodesulfovibrio senegalensis]KAB1443400.1 L-seryl-tRNA(Sec) selenium transferase [Pseudodesulfovibrio senegalensis]